jgi:hypothetical protein
MLYLKAACYSKQKKGSNAWDLKTVQLLGLGAAPEAQHAAAGGSVGLARLCRGRDLEHVGHGQQVVAVAQVIVS